MPFIRFHLVTLVHTKLDCLELYINGTNEHSNTCFVINSGSVSPVNMNLFASNTSNFIYVSYVQVIQFAIGKLK